MAIASIEKVKEELCALKRKSKYQALAWNATMLAPSVAAALVQTYTLGMFAPQFSWMRADIVLPAVFWGAGVGLGARFWSGLKYMMNQEGPMQQQMKAMGGASGQQNTLLKEEMSSFIAPCVAWDLSKVFFISEPDAPSGAGGVDKDGYIGISADYLKQDKKDAKWFVLAHEEGHWAHGEAQKYKRRETASWSAMLLNFSLFAGNSVAALGKMAQGAWGMENALLFMGGSVALVASFHLGTLVKRKMERNNEYNADSYAALCMGSAEAGKDYFKRGESMAALVEMMARPPLYWKLDRLLIKACGGDACLIKEKSTRHKIYLTASKALNAVYHQLDVLDSTHPTHSSRLKNLERLEKRMVKRGVFAPPSPK